MGHPKLTPTALRPQDYLLFTLLTDREVIALSQQPSQQDREPGGQLAPLPEQVAQGSQGHVQGDGGIHLTEGKFCGNKREAR